VTVQDEPERWLVDVEAGVRRREQKRLDRLEKAARRKYGVAKRNARKLRQIRGKDTP